MKKLEDWAAVQQVYKKTGSQRKTAKILGISRNTVKKLINLTEAPEYKKRNYTSKIDPYKEQIITWRCKPYDFNGTRIFRELKKRGYEGSIGPVYRYLKIIEEDVEGHISCKATVRIETPPGDQAQFDWSEYEMLIGGEYKRVYCFSLILAASRKKAVCFSLKADAASIYEAIQEMFDEFGGVTLELLIDNPKALVVNNNPRSEEEVKYNINALMLAKHLGTELNACPCYWPRKKGKIEKPYQYIEEQFVKGNSFETMEELNTRGKQFIYDWCNEKHTTTQRIPNQHYLIEEKSTLSTLPKKHYYINDLKKRKVSNDSLVCIDGSKYSVPVKYACKEVYYRINYGFRIMIYDKSGNFITSHEVASEHNSIKKVEKHYEEIAPRVSTSIPQIRRDFTKTFRNGARYLEEAGKRFVQPTHYARKILKLREYYEDDVLDRFIEIAIKENKMDFKSFKKILREYNSRIDVNDLKAEYEPSATIDSHLLSRDCSYYENIAKEMVRNE